MPKRKASAADADARIAALQKKLAKYKKLVDDEVAAMTASTSNNEKSEDSDESEDSQPPEDDTPVTSSEDSDEEKENTPAIKLDEQTLQLLGANSKKKNDTFELHEDLAECWREIIVDGIKKSSLELSEKYPRKGNCPLQTPSLNPEITSLLNKSVKSRDKYLAMNQDLCGLGLVAMGQAINLIFHEERDGIDKEELLQLLCDSSKYLCELMHQLTKTRKIYIYPCVDEKYKPILENAVTDDLLFGADLSKRIKSACSVEKIVLSIKPNNDKKNQNRKNLNWRRPSNVQQASSQTGSRGNRFHRNGSSTRSAGNRQLTSGQKNARPLPAQPSDPK